MGEKGINALDGIPKQLILKKMVNINDGGQVEKLKGTLKSISVNPCSNRNRKFELWLKSDGGGKGLGDDSVSYLTLDEMLNLRDEIEAAIKDSLRIGK